MHRCAMASASLRLRLYVYPARSQLRPQIRLRFAPGMGICQIFPSLMHAPCSYVCMLADRRRFACLFHGFPLGKRCLGRKQDTEIVFFRSY